MWTLLLIANLSPLDQEAGIQKWQNFLKENQEVSTRFDMRFGGEGGTQFKGEFKRRGDFIRVDIGQKTLIVTARDFLEFDRLHARYFESPVAKPGLGDLPSQFFQEPELPIGYDPNLLSFLKSAKVSAAQSGNVFIGETIGPTKTKLPVRFEVYDSGAPKLLLWSLEFPEGIATYEHRYAEPSLKPIPENIFALSPPVGFASYVCLESPLPPMPDFSIKTETLVALGLKLDKIDSKVPILLIFVQDDCQISAELRKDESIVKAANREGIHPEFVTLNDERIRALKLQGAFIPSTPYAMLLNPNRSIATSFWGWGAAPEAKTKELNQFLATYKASLRTSK